MKTILLKWFIVFVILLPGFLHAQITTPVIRANFGVDADLRSSFFNGLVQAGNDDWYRLPGSDTLGKFIIDTTGCASILAGYLSDVSPWPRRMASFYRTMKYPSFTVVNNRLLLDALFVRDYHGRDTTTFAAGSNKNGMSPVNWTGVVQNVPDKNDILDMYIHLRRAGPTKFDSLWMFGGLSMDNTTGNRYFDFEMYQTDIYYDRVTQKFYGYGPDAGHTSWQFDANGNVTTPGDIIFTGSFQSSTLTNIEARIWVHQSALSITPAQFNWSGQFDGASAGAVYGYASIAPKTAGAFYTGLGCVNNTWAGPFGLVLQDNSLAFTNPGPATISNSKYVADQFIEFSVNMTKLGLDPVASISGDICGTPFRRILVKTRASASFTAELKDFVAPTDLFLAPRVDAAASPYILCSQDSYSDISVINPYPTSVYLWSTPNGHIVTNPPEGTTIRVDRPGTYIVTQYLQAGCSPYATDTVAVVLDTNCTVLPKVLLDFKGKVNKNSILLNWSVTNNSSVQYFNLERSRDGINFETISRMENNAPESNEAFYETTDMPENWLGNYIFYRLKIAGINGSTAYSKTIRLMITEIIKNEIAIIPNPAADWAQLHIRSATNTESWVSVYNINGKKIYSRLIRIEPGMNTCSLEDIYRWPRGVYQVVVQVGGEMFFRKFIVAR
jgi:hypothetical protein